MKNFLSVVFVGVSFLLSEGKTQAVTTGFYSNVAQNQEVDSSQEKPVSSGLTVTEVIREDGTKEETIHLTEYPVANRSWKYGHQEFQRLTFKDLAAPSITLSLHQKVVLKFDPSYKFLYYFSFDKRKKEFSILHPNLMTSSSKEYSWDQEPYDASSWAWWSSPYFKSWTATAPGTILLTFRGEVWVTDETSIPVNLNISVTVVE